MEHRHKDNIRCPYCNWEDTDSWKFDSDGTNHTCGDCGKEFNVEVHTSITYSTTRIDCGENEQEHTYKLEGVFEKNMKFENREWSDLSESEIKFYKIIMCSICGDKEYVEIGKDEHSRLLSIL